MLASGLRFLSLLLVCLPLATLAQDVKVWVPGWKSTSALSTARAGGAVFAHNKRLYAIGGIDGRNFLATSEFAAVVRPGELAAWTPTSTMTEPRGFFDTAVHKGYVYAVGGGNGPAGHNLLRSVERAALLDSGELGPWQREANMLNVPRRCVKVFVAGDRLYAAGGFGGTLLDSVESAQILPDGSLGPWRMETDAMNQRRYVHGIKPIGNAVLVVGGHNEQQGTGMTETELAMLDAKGVAGPWRAGKPLTHGRYGLAVAQVGDFVYALGGLGGIDYLSSIEKARLGASGEPSAWALTSPLPSSRANFGVVVQDDFLYVVGGTNAEGYFDAVHVAQINERGDPGYWASKAEAHAFDSERSGPQQAHPHAAVQMDRGLQAVVAEVIDTERYTYLRVTTPEGEEWLATGKGQFKVGQTLHYGEGVTMTNFHSQALQRTFPQIRFVGSVR